MVNPLTSSNFLVNDTVWRRANTATVIKITAEEMCCQGKTEIRM